MAGINFFEPDDLMAKWIVDYSKGYIIPDFYDV